VQRCSGFSGNAVDDTSAQESGAGGGPGIAGARVALEVHAPRVSRRTEDERDEGWASFARTVASFWSYLRSSLEQS
jgi:hypothetical protein